MHPTGTPSTHADLSVKAKAKARAKATRKANATTKALDVKERRIAQLSRAQLSYREVVLRKFVVRELVLRKLLNSLMIPTRAQHFRRMLSPVSLVRHRHFHHHVGVQVQWRARGTQKWTRRIALCIGTRRKSVM